MSCFTDKTQLIEAFNYITKEYGTEILDSPNRLRTLLMDLAPDFQRQTRIFLNVVSNAEIVNIVRKNPSLPFELIIKRICDEVGLSEEWSKEAAVMLFAFLGCDAVLEQYSTTVVNRLEEGKRKEEERSLAGEIRKRAEARLKPIRETTVKKASSLISANDRHTVGLKSDGTVIAVGKNEADQCNVSGWRDIVAVASGHYHIVGLKSDGTAVAVGENKYGQCKVSGWKLFENIDTLEEERDQKKRLEEKRIAEQKCIIEERRNSGVCQHCGGEFKKKLFQGLICEKCGEAKDY